jgi:lipoyl(octanoyl) transferase
VDDVVAFVRAMERAIVAALADEGLESRARPDEGPDFTGVWTEDRKIASIGVHVSRGVTTHGFAVNVENDLQPFEWIVPCGLEGVRMTSVIKERHDPAPGALPALKEHIVARFAAEHGRKPRTVAPGDLAVAGVPSP